MTLYPPFKLWRIFWTASNKKKSNIINFFVLLLLHNILRRAASQVLNWTLLSSLNSTFQGFSEVSFERRRLARTWKMRHFVVMLLKKFILEAVFLVRLCTSSFSIKTRGSQKFSHYSTLCFIVVDQLVFPWLKIRPLFKFSYRSYFIVTISSTFLY